MGIPAPIGIGASGLPALGDQANAVVTGAIAAIGTTKPFAFRGPMNLAIWAAINTTLTTTAGSLSSTLASATEIAIGNAVNSVNVPPGTTLGGLSGTTGTLSLPTLTLPGSINASNGQVILPAGSNVARLAGAAVALSSNAENATIAAGTTVTAIIQTDIAPTSDPASAGRPGIIQLSTIPSVAPALSGPIPMEFGLAAGAITVAGADTAAKFTGALIAYTGTVQLERSFDGCRTWLLANVGGTGQLAQYSNLSSISLTFGEPEKQVYYRLNCIALTPVAGLGINYRFSQTGGAAESLAIGPLI